MQYADLNDDELDIRKIAVITLVPMPSLRSPAWSRVTVSSPGSKAICRCYAAAIEMEREGVGGASVLARCSYLRTPVLGKYERGRD